MIYLKGLNGIRTIAAFGVLITHINIWRSNFNVPNGRDSLMAPYGVTMFFALSGFLITYLLLKEKEKMAGKIDVKKFYVRRILRIWPLYFLYLFVAITTIFFYQSETLHTYNTVFYFTLMANVPYALNSSLPHLGHYWSLAVEEQFYLFWPWLLRIKNELRALFFFFSFFLFLKLSLHFLFKNNTVDYFCDLLRFDCMGIGGLGAVLLYQKRPLLKILYNPIVQVVCWCFVVAVIINRFHIISLIDHDIFAFITTTILINQCSNQKVLMSLDNKICNFLGKISFGIYVYHPLVIFFFAKILNTFLIEESIFKYVLIYTGVFGVTIFIAYISYNYFEKYFLQKRKNFTIIQSSNSRE